MVTIGAAAGVLGMLALAVDMSYVYTQRRPGAECGRRQRISGALMMAKHASLGTGRS